MALVIDAVRGVELGEATPALARAWESRGDRTSVAAKQVEPGVWTSTRAGAADARIALVVLQTRPAYRPSAGLSEGQRQVRGPAALLEAMDARAEQLGVSASEVWRRAARAWLGASVETRSR